MKSSSRSRIAAHADGLLEPEDEAGPDRLDDRRRAALLAVLDVVEVDVLGRVDVGDGAAAGHRGDAVAEEVAAGDQDAGRAGSADELVGRDEDGVLRVEGGVVGGGGSRPVPPSACGAGGGAISISTYGAAAAKSQNESAPWRWSSTEMARVSDRMPVTFDAAEKLPILSGRSACRTSSASRRARSIRPSASSGIVTTSAIDSRHGSSLLWCS